MAISYFDISPVADSSGGTTAAPVYPPGITEGKNLTLVMLYKSPPSAHDVVPGFVEEAVHTAGLGSNTTSDQGGVTLGVFTRTATGSETGSLTLNVPGSSVIQAVIVVHDAAPGSTWDIAAAIGAQNTPVNIWSVLLGSNPGLTVGDVVLVAMGINSNNSGVSLLNSQALTAPGVTTWGSVVERVDAPTGTGRDQHLGLTEHTVVAGTATGEPTYSVSTSVNATANTPTGPVIALRLREVAAPQPPQIVAHPEARSVVQPNAATFTANITGADTLQWLRREGGTGTGVAVVGGSGATTLSYVTGATSVSGGNHNNGDTYALQGTNAQGTVTTNYAPLTVNELGSDAEPPGIPGTPVASGLTKSAVTLTHTAATDNVGVTGYEYQIGAEAVVDTGSTALAVVLSGRTPGSTISYQVRAYDAAGNRGNWSQPVGVTFPIYGFNFATLPQMQAGSFVGSLVGLGLDVGVGVVVRANDASSGDVVATSGTLTTDVQGRLANWKAGALDLGVSYEVVFRRVSDGARDIKVLTATL